MNPFGPQGANSATLLPPTNTKVVYGAADTWVKDSTGNGFNNGTVLDAAFFNNIIGALQYIINSSGIRAPARGDFTALWRAIQQCVTVMLDTYAPLASPPLTGTPTAPTNPNPADTSHQIATDAFVQAAIANAIGNLGLATYVDSAIPAAVATALTAWVASLPTTLPSTPGLPWNDGGVISIS